MNATQHSSHRPYTRLLLNSIYLFLLLAHCHSIASAQDPSDQTSPFDDVFATETDQPPATPSFPLGPDIYFGPGPGPGGGGNPGPGTPSLPGILRGLIRGRGTSGGGPCNGGGTPASDRQLFEILVYRGVCAKDGVSPGTSRVCADLPAVRPNQSLLGRSPCLVPPPLSAPIWRNVTNCAYSNFLHKDATLAPNYRAGSTRSSYPPQTACQVRIVQTTCADVDRLKNTPPFSYVYASQFAPYSNPNLSAAMGPPFAMGPLYSQANYTVNLPGQVPAGVEPGASEQANALSRFGLMARYCAGLAPPTRTLRTQASTNACSSDPTSQWLITLSNALEAQNPHYDMTKSGEGLRLIRDAYINLGFGWLARAPAVGRNLAAAGGWNWGTRQAVEIVLPSVKRLPPGFSLPAVIENTPRPLFLQQRNASCGLACIKMVMATLGRQSAEERIYRLLAGLPRFAGDIDCYVPNIGTSPERLTDLLTKLGVRARLARGQTIANLQAATKNGYPAMVGLGPDGGIHAFIVDGVIPDAYGNLYVVGRDPGNLSLLNPITRQNFIKRGFDNFPVVRATNFAQPDTWGGAAIYLEP